jgi:hypothetical protein
MKLNRYLIEADGIPEPTEEMKRYYNQRTYEHIAYVNKAASKLVKQFPELTKLMNTARAHDRSKFEKHEYIPYVWMSWKRKKGNESFQYPSNDIEQAVEKAVKHHMKTNRHHPEFHSNTNKMTVIDIAEMVCDWHSFHYEFGDDTKKWADNNIGKRWNFNPMATKLIYKYIEVLMNS